MCPNSLQQATSALSKCAAQRSAPCFKRLSHQGDCKWFIVDLVEEYSEALKKLGVFTERQLSRMADAALLSDIVFTLSQGLKSSSDRALDKFYEDNEATFPEEDALRARVTAAMDRILAWPDLHGSALMKSYNFYTLLPAISHALSPIQQGNFNDIYPRNAPAAIDPQFALPNLTRLAAALDEPGAYPQLSEYVAACSKATTRFEQRKTRFVWLSKALEPNLLP